MYATLSDSKCKIEKMNDNKVMIGTINDVSHMFQKSYPFCSGQIKKEDFETGKQLTQKLTEKDERECELDDRENELRVPEQK